MPEPTVLRSVLADYPHTTALKRGELTAPGLRLDFHDIKPVHKAFAPMVRDEAFDLCELAIVTCLQAIAYGRPVVVLPVVVASRFQRGCLIAHASHGAPAPDGLAGARIGVRAYTQTTGMWVRAHLAEDYGVTSDQVRWVTRDGAHVEQYTDPGYVERSIGDRALLDLLRDGEIDAAILGNDRPTSDEFVPVIADADARDTLWWRRSGVMPTNHVVVAGAAQCRRDATAVRSAYELLRRADGAVTRPADAPRPTLFGFERLYRPVETVINACLDQDLLPRKLSVEEVFGPAREVLGHAAD